MESLSNDSAASSLETSPALPPILAAERATPALAPRPWYLGLAPAYLGLFVWAPFFDQLWIGVTPGSNPVLPAGEAIVASLVCFAFLYLPLALWGLRTRQRLGIVAASTFGAAGSEWIIGIAIASASIVWYAVAVNFALDSTLLGLHSSGLIERASLSGVNLGAVTVKSPVFLCTALFWIFITGMSSLWRLTGVVVALMRVYSPIALVLLTGTAAWFLPKLGAFPGANADLSVIELVTGFFVIAALSSVDWGAASRNGRDLVVGGLTGVVLASFWTAMMALVVVAGAGAWSGLLSQPNAISPGDPLPLSFRWAVWHGIGGYGAGAILILFGLAALAPACYAVSSFEHRFATHWPWLRRSRWTWCGGAVAFALMATSAVDRTAWVYHATGALFAPAIGAMVGDFLRQRGQWAGVRPGTNVAGLTAWGIGCATAVALEFRRTFIPGSAGIFELTSIWGFVVSAVSFGLLVMFVRERAPVPIDGPPGDCRA